MYFGILGCVHYLGPDVVTSKDANLDGCDVGGFGKTDVWAQGAVGESSVWTVAGRDTSLWVVCGDPIVSCGFLQCLHLST